MSLTFDELHVFDKSLSKYVPSEMLESLQAESARRLALLKRAEPWLKSYLEYLDTDMPLLGEPNATVANLVDELAEELK
ncbi:hypothetical protein LCGC14_2725330 [marine sediment metagenome]|uniref:Uncharacterized protein n=1 Tax=marine sediment metagenome TaxID=412755 RepID=A0A0F9C0J5_9ZZZZ